MTVEDGAWRNILMFIYSIFDTGDNLKNFCISLQQNKEYDIRQFKERKGLFDIPLGFPLKIITQNVHRKEEFCDML